MPTATPPNPSGRWTPALREIRDVFVSLKLTIALLVLSMVLIFAATLDQVNLGVWSVQEKYFRSFVVYINVGRFTFPAFPGGYTIGGLLLINLISAHAFRFTFAWRKTGIFLTHLGLIVLLVGELLTGLWQEDNHMRLSLGETKDYAESFRNHELVVSDVTDPFYADVVAIPERFLASKIPVQHPKLPFRVETKAYYPNSSLLLRSAAGAAPMADSTTAATAGMGSNIAAAPQPMTYRPDERNIPSALVDLIGPDGPLGSYLVSAHLLTPQTFTHNGRTWEIALRVERSYQPFSLTLLRFSHDRYAGTEIPKNFSSRLRLLTPDASDDREVLIYMNNPLRQGGRTFYQAGFENDDRTTVLQVVRNPSWFAPYLACALIALGLCVQFGMHLLSFVAKQRSGKRAGVTLENQNRASPSRTRTPPAGPAVPEGNAP